MRVGVGGATVLMWNGSDFEPSALGSDSWSDEDSVLMWVERVPSTLRGRLILVSYSTDDQLEDITSEITLSNQWRVLVSDLSVTHGTASISLELEIFDLDSTSEEMSLNWSLVDGLLRVIDTESDVNTFSPQYEVPSDKLGTEMASVLARVCDSGVGLDLPPIGLSLTGSVFRFVEAVLDQSEVTVGLLMTAIITGRIVVEGHMLVERMELGFRSPQGAWVNLTISGVDGNYSFRVSAASLAPASYDVYAVATVRTIGRVELQFATLDVVQSYLPVLTIVLVVGLCVLLVKYSHVLLSQRFGRRE
ncbi:MAG: hypothetical protein QXS20_09405 [Candidatus Thorarchaeota archaeon]